MDPRTVTVLPLLILLASAPAHADSPCPPISDPDSTIEDCTYEIRSGTLTPDRLAIAYTNRAEAWNEKGEFDNALSDSNKALSLNPQFAEALGARGLAWQGKGDYDHAIADYSANLNAKSNDADWWLAMIYTRRGAAWGLKGDLEQCIADSSEAIRRDPKTARAFYNRGLAWKLRGDYDQAIADYRGALQNNPADPRALKSMPGRWSQMGKAEQAEVLFKDVTFSGLISTSPDVARLYDVKPTRFGKVLIVARRKGGPIPDTMLLNGGTVFQSLGMYLHAHATYAMGDTDVVLFGANGGGVGEGDALHFLIIGAHGTTKVVATKEFYSADYTIMPRQERNAVVVDLGFEEGKKKIAILRAGKLMVQYVPVGVSPVALEDCTWLHEYSTDECIRFKNLKLDCEQYGRGYPSNGAGSVAVMDGARALSNQPGFVSSALGDLCVRMCTTSQPVPFEVFKKTVCSIK
jgi:Tfp pilus assembly protein PilF